MRLATTAAAADVHFREVSRSLVNMIQPLELKLEPKFGRYPGAQEGVVAAWVSRRRH